MKVLSINHVNNNPTIKAKVASTAPTKAITPIIIAAPLVSLTRTSYDNEDNYQIRNLSVDEYNIILSRIIESKSKKLFPSFRFVYDRKLNEWNAQLLNYMLNHPEEFKNKHTELIKSIAGEVGTVPTTRREAEVVLSAMKKPYVINNKVLEGSIFHQAWLASDSQKESDVKIKIFEKLNEIKPEINIRQSYNLVDVIKDINTEDGFKVTEKFIENPSLIPAEHMFDNGIFHKFNTENNANFILEIMNKFINNPELLRQECSDYALKAILEHSYGNDDKKYFIINILKNPNFFKSESFLVALDQMLTSDEFEMSTNDTTQLDLQINLINTIAKKPNLFDNPDFLKNMMNILELNSPKQPNDYKKRIRHNYDIQKFLIENGYYG